MTGVQTCALPISVEGDRITGLADGYTAPAASDTVVELKNATVMPGLMDMHVHLTGEFSGARDNLNTALRDAVAKGWVVGPRIFSVGKALPPPAVMVTPPTGSRKSTAVIPARKKA